MKVIAGLGNPGDKFEGTRHNLGFKVVDELKDKLDFPQWTDSKHLKGLYTKKIINGEEIELIKPSTYMNLSGLSLSYAFSHHAKELDKEDIIIVHDDLDLLLGKIKVRVGGSAAGHHGVENIIEKLGFDNFVRVRLGIGTYRSFSGEHKRISFNAEHFVTEPFLPQEHPKVKVMLKHALVALETILNEGIDKAQNQFN